MSPLRDLHSVEQCGAVQCQVVRKGCITGVTVQNAVNIDT